MTDRDGLLRTIIENPHDDAPRLIYADWLEEHGEPERAEFIRVQCKLAAFDVAKCALPETIVAEKGSPCGLCPWCLLARSAQRLLFEHARKWLPASVPGFAWTNEDRACTFHLPVDGRSVDRALFVFRRGFIAEAAMTCASWLRFGQAIQAAMPLEKLTLSHLAAGRIMEDEDGVLAYYVYPSATRRSPDRRIELGVRGGTLWWDVGFTKAGHPLSVRVRPLGQYAHGDLYDMDIEGRLRQRMPDARF